MRVSAPIVAGAKTVGTVAIETPLRPLIADIALLALLGAALGAGVYAGAHFLPMRALRRASGELGETQAALRQQVAKTDAALQEARIERGRAELANRAKSEFLANMSHELRTPLNAVIGFAELMKNRAAGPLSDEYADYAGDIQGSGQHLLAIVNDILDIAKLESGMMRLNPETVDLRELLTDCVGTVYMRAAAAGIRIAIDADPAHALHAVLDLTRVRQVLLNLLSNAVKFTPDAGRVAVSVREEAGWWVIAVADTGVGMNEEEVELAFLPFRQIDNSYARRFQGTGLGLPLARALAELHGGSLVLASAPGKGTTATLRLPRDPLGGAAGDGGKDGAGAETRGGRASLAA
jgi:signal transduction histidine kinase